MSQLMEIVNTISRDDVIDLLSKLVRIPSENYRPDRTKGGEAEISMFLDQTFKEIGFDNVQTQDSDIAGAHNTIGLIKGAGGGASLLFNGHTDTVPASTMPDPFSAKIVDGNLFGRGATDMKGGLASMITACRCLIEAKVALKGDLLMTAVVDEEVTHEGIARLVKSGIKADYAVVGEGTGLNITYASKGKAEFKIDTHGKAAHASRPNLGINAIAKMARVISALDTTVPQILEKKTHAEFGTPAFTIVNIHGGVFPVTLSTVPDYCRIEIDRRLIPGETYDEAYGEIQNVLEKIKNQDAALQVELDFTDEIKRYPRLPFVTPKDSQIVTSLSESCLKVTNKKPKLIIGQGYGDAEALRNKLGIHTVDFGPSSDESSAHSANEHVSINQVVDAAKILAMTAMTICGVSK
jgi:acetylornithine deacetylase